MLPGSPSISSCSHPHLLAPGVPASDGSVSVLVSAHDPLQSFGFARAAARVDPLALRHARHARHVLGQFQSYN